MKSSNTQIMSEIIQAWLLELDPLLAARFLISQSSQAHA